jgi:4a-hydroxytetrahydrobiopterin dehydratase
MSSGAAAERELGFPCMDMLKGERIAEANLTDWRKLAQGLHARYLVDDFGAGARFVAAVGEAQMSVAIHDIWPMMSTP